MHTELASASFTAMTQKGTDKSQGAARLERKTRNPESPAPNSWRKTGGAPSPRRNGGPYRMPSNCSTASCEPYPWQPLSALGWEKLFKICSEKASLGRRSAQNRSRQKRVPRDIDCRVPQAPEAFRPASGRRAMLNLRTVRGIALLDDVHVLPSELGFGACKNNKDKTPSNIPIQSVSKRIEITNETAMPSLTPRPNN